MCVEAKNVFFFLFVRKKEFMENKKVVGKKTEKIVILIVIGNGL